MTKYPISRSLIEDGRSNFVLRNPSGGKKTSHPPTHPPTHLSLIYPSTPTYLPSYRQMTYPHVSPFSSIPTHPPTSFPPTIGLGVTCPVRIIHSLVDEEVPFQTALHLADCVQTKDVKVRREGRGRGGGGSGGGESLVQSTHLPFCL